MTKSAVVMTKKACSQVAFPASAVIIFVLSEPLISDPPQAYDRGVTKARKGEVS